MTATALSVFDTYQQDYTRTREVEMTFEEYLEECRTNKGAYANAWERLLKAIGEPEIIDYSKEPKLRSVFEGLPMPRYPGFADFYGIEEAAKQVVSFVRSAAQGGEESKQILYLLGPVGGGKSSLARRLTELMEQEPFYAIKGSPVFDNPLSAFDARRHGDLLESKYGVDRRYLKTKLSPWALQQLETYGGDLRKFKVVKVYPSIQHQRAISRVEAGDKNNQDVTSIIGKVDLSKLDAGLSQQDPRAYGYSGGLNLGNRGVMEFVEMFKAPIDALNPLLAATQDRQYNGTEAIGALPFEGIILAHSNEAEWGKFRNNPTNEAFIDRVRIIKVPYTLRLSEEEKIYEKYIRESQLKGKPCAPGTAKLLAEFAVMTRICDPKDGSSLETKMKVYDGEKTNDAKAKTLAAYRKEAYDAGTPEGMSGWSVRDSFKALSEAFNFHAAEGEVSASPIDLMFILDRTVKGQDLPNDTRDRYLLILDKMLKPEYAKTVKRELQEALVESFQAYGQNIFERYVAYADLALTEDEEFVDPFTKSPINRQAVEKELSAIEKPANIGNPKDFRNEVVRFVQREQLKNNGKMPDWTLFKKFADAIESKILSSTKDLMPLISFGQKASVEEDKKHADFVDRMVARGYTPRQVRQVVDWHQKNQLG